MSEVKKDILWLLDHVEDLTDYLPPFESHQAARRWYDSEGKSVACRVLVKPSEKFLMLPSDRPQKERRSGIW